MVEQNSSFISEWKNTYQSMDPEEIINFLNYWVQELNELHQIKFDPLSKGIILNCLFKETLDAYPGNLISNEIKNKLATKLNEKINPFEKMRIKIEKLIDENKLPEVKQELSNIFKFYDEFINLNEYIDQNLNNFLFNVIKNSQIKEVDLKILEFLTNSYLDFLKNKDGDLNLALFFIRLASFFSNNDRIYEVKKCLIYSKQIYNSLGFDEDESKIDRILTNFQDIEKPKKAKKSKKRKK
ncbi:MAG: hypothetical protein EAX96_08100 [Candidatus Lokiarchaeota archaeon]|nr:hypothetical protein [Candidatus Lokiarchaeota archaeon]